MLLPGPSNWDATTAGVSLILLRRHTERFTTAGKAPADVAREALTHLCQVLLNSSEFLYTP